LNGFKTEINQIVKKKSAGKPPSICGKNDIFSTSDKIKVWLKPGKREKKLLDHYDHEQSNLA